MFSSVIPTQEPGSLLKLYISFFRVRLNILGEGWRTKNMIARRANERDFSMGVENFIYVGPAINYVMFTSRRYVYL